MPKFLLIESSGNVCSTAVAVGGKIVAEKSIEEPNSHSTYLATFIEEVLQQSGLKTADLDAVVVAGGPGSYTGLRIGCSLAKGLCFGASVPLISCSSLLALAVAAFQKDASLQRVISLIDARRMDAYMGVFDRELNAIEEERFVTIDEQLFATYTSGGNGASGSGVAKWLESYPQKHVASSEIVDVYAANLLPEATKKWEQKAFEDVAYFEPNYIKSVFLTKPKPKF